MVNQQCPLPGELASNSRLIRRTRRFESLAEGAVDNKTCLPFQDYPGKEHRLVLNTSNVLQVWQQWPQSWCLLMLVRKGYFPAFLLDLQTAISFLCSLLSLPVGVAPSSFLLVKTHVLLNYSLTSLADSASKQLFSEALTARVPTYKVLEQPKLAYNWVDLTFLRCWEHSWMSLSLWRHEPHDEQPDSLAPGR